jgi:hypothetical protein
VAVFTLRPKQAERPPLHDLSFSELNNFEHLATGVSASAMARVHSMADASLNSLAIQGEELTTLARPIDSDGA